MTTTTAPTGDQYELTRGAVRAVITQVAASLRVLEVDGVALTPGYAQDSTPPFGCGITLAPWPNRVADGRWMLDGQVQQLDLTEVARMNALHGLLRNTEYRLVDRHEASVTLGARIYPQHGYPFLVDTGITYALTEDGLDTTHTATNLSDRPAPVAFGTHPFFCIGGVPTEELTLTLHASTRFVVDDHGDYSDPSAPAYRTPQRTVHVSPGSSQRTPSPELNASGGAVIGSIATARPCPGYSRVVKTCT